MWEWIKDLSGLTKAVIVTIFTTVSAGLLLHVLKEKYDETKLKRKTKEPTLSDHGHTIASDISSVQENPPSPLARFKHITLEQFPGVDWYWTWVGVAPKVDPSTEYKKYITNLLPICPLCKSTITLRPDGHHANEWTSLRCDNDECHFEIRRRGFPQVVLSQVAVAIERAIRDGSWKKHIPESTQPLDG